ncbi:hypothetical protein VFPPC_15582 [Pochonia chlamydosporia 170]|uniref:Uncharacterized protein n=1 Tax=Pochonia chlamydosporia 170 TaxID=1380566 RepID=A0A179FXS3_METCM|nr:hypothetical protein VFPPC_15582 [Pochonia chlamydosporia 170]OAQ70465.2 hypothetical protein VFPPC_15582 [Pochonia chlamydosporia 170]
MAMEENSPGRVSTQPHHHRDMNCKTPNLAKCNGYSASFSSPDCAGSSHPHPLLLDFINARSIRPLFSLPVCVFFFSFSLFLATWHPQLLQIHERQCRVGTADLIHCPETTVHWPSKVDWDTRSPESNIPH